MTADRSRRLEGAPVRAMRLLARAGSEGAPSASESASGMRAGMPADVDRADIARRLAEALRERTPSLPGQDPSAEADGLAADIVQRARKVLEGLAGGASATAARDADLAAFEAVMQVRGRPALRIVDQRVEPISDVLHPGSGFWRAFVNDHDALLVEVAAATGAVKAGPKGSQLLSVRGTAWLVAPDLVVTNRHVLFPPPGGLVLAARRSAEPTRARILTDHQVVLDFAHDGGPARQLAYAVDEVPFVSLADDPVDVALLRVRPTGSPSGLLPKPLALDKDGTEPRHLFVVGHPGPVSEVPEAVQAVFGTPDGRKRVSPGSPLEAQARPAGELWHDASTIGGFSGGCVLGFGRSGVAALHFRGHPLHGNRAITAAALRAHEAWSGLGA